MTRLIVTIVIWLVLVVGAVAQNQHKYVGDFTGGWVNGVANAFVPDNAAPVLSNYDIKDGALTRRSGMGFLWSDTSAPYIGGLFPYAHYRDKNLFIMRHIDSRLADSVADTNTQALVKYNPTNHDAEYILEPRVFDAPWRAHQYDDGFDWAVVFHRLFIGGYNGELVYITDSSAMPARPRGPAQAAVHAINAGGNVSGIVRYRYLFLEKDAPDTSNFSIPTFPVNVDNGKVYIYDIDTALDAEGIDSILIYREMDRDSSYEFLVRIPEGQTYYLDTFTTTSDADTLAYEWGPIPKPSTLNCTDTTDCDDDTEHIFAPGEISDAGVYLWGLPSDLDVDIGGGAPSNCHYILYTYRYIDSLGRASYWAPYHAMPLSCVSGEVDSLYAHIFFYSLPRDPGLEYVQFAKTYLSAGVGGDFVDTLGWWFGGTRSDQPFVSKTYAHVLDTIWDFYGVATGWWDDSLYAEWDTASADLSRVMYDDSVWTTDPPIIEYHAQRMWGAGNPEYPDYLYYSAIGRPTTLQAFIRVASQQGDGITGLLSIADVDYYDNALPADQLVIFKAASVWVLSGFTFTDYHLSQLMSGVGLVAPRGYCKTNEGVYFVGADGLYQIGQPKALSLSIQATVDSAKTYLSRSVLKSVGQEVWWSLPVGDTVNNRTLIWSTTPKPHWKSYSFAMRDVIPYDTTQDWTAHSTDRSLILTESDSVFRWNYADADSLDGAARVQATYRSKFFFEGGGREKIKWIDLFGTGESAVLKFVFHRNYSQGSGERFDSVYLTPNFADHTRDRIKVEAVCENFALEIIDSAGLGEYTITGYDIVYIPWDKGKRR